MTTMLVPDRSLDQRMAALETANRVRSARKEWKRRLKAEDATVVDLMGDPLCDTMKVYDALKAHPKLGRVKVNRMLGRMSISPSKTLGGLSYRQRGELLRYLSLS